MISETIPEDIQDIIVSVYAENISDPEMDKILPPRIVRDALLGEKGIKTPLGEAQQALARDWCRRQQEIQTRAMKASEHLAKSEPLSEKMALQGHLPKWAVLPWAETLLLEWSAGLEEAVAEAEEYLSSKVR